MLLIFVIILNAFLGIPDDIDPAKQIAGSTTPAKVKIPHPHVKKSKILLGKAGVINVLQEDAPPPPPKSPDRDPFNISNDLYYMPRSSETSLRLKVGGGTRFFFFVITKYSLVVFINLNMCF